MRGVDADGVFRWAFESDESAGLCAVTVQHVELEHARKLQESRRCDGVGRVRFAADGQAIDAELHLRRDGFQCRIGAFASSQAVGQNAHLMAALGLSFREIEDMADDSADGSADGMQDTKRAIREGHAFCLALPRLKSMTCASLTAQQP